MRNFILKMEVSWLFHFVFLFATTTLLLVTRKHAQLFFNNAASKFLKEVYIILGKKFGVNVPKHMHVSYLRGSGMHCYYRLDTSVEHGSSGICDAPKYSECENDVHRGHSVKGSCTDNNNLVLL